MSKLSTITDKKTKIMTLVRHYRSLGMRISLRAFVDEINQYLPPSMRLKFQTIWNWENGKHMPRIGHMYLLSQNGKGWVKKFAQDILEILEEESNT